MPVDTPSNPNHTRICEPLARQLKVLAARVGLSIDTPLQVREDILNEVSESVHSSIAYWV